MLEHSIPSQPHIVPQAFVVMRGDLLEKTKTLLTDIQKFEQEFLRTKGPLVDDYDIQFDFSVPRLLRDYHLHARIMRAQPLDSPAMKLLILLFVSLDNFERVLHENEKMVTIKWKFQVVSRLSLPFYRENA